MVLYLKLILVYLRTFLLESIHCMMQYYSIYLYIFVSQTNNWVCVKCSELGIVSIINHKFNAPGLNLKHLCIHITDFKALGLVASVIPAIMLQFIWKLHFRSLICCIAQAILSWYPVNHLQYCCYLCHYLLCNLLSLFWTSHR